MDPKTMWNSIFDEKYILVNRKAGWCTDDEIDRWAVVSIVRIMLCEGSCDQAFIKPMIDECVKWKPIMSVTRYRI